MDYEPGFLQYPQINLNGTDALDLARQYFDAAKAVERAANLQANILHGRDYQTLPHEAYMRAKNDMLDRQKKLIEVYNDLMRIGENCVSQER